MFLSISKQLKLIKYFVSFSEFWWKCLIIDNRFFPIISWLDKEIEIGSLSSLNIIIPEWRWFKLWKFYPKQGTELFTFYELLIKKWLEIDLDILNLEKYNYYKQKQIRYKWLNISLIPNKNTLNLYQKYFNLLDDFSLNNKWIVPRFLKKIKPDNNIIKLNIEMYLNNFKKYINFKKSINNKEIKYKKELEKYFLDYRIFEFKMRIKFYKLLLNKWYTTLEEVFEWKTIDIKKINYYKNISVKDEKYTWIIHKVYNVISSKEMKDWYIMVAENTNPEFIDAFYKAIFIAVETNSELSHAAITCKELKIPLALWAKNIFFASDNWQKININTKNKTINL